MKTQFFRFEHFMNKFADIFWIIKINKVKGPDNRVLYPMQTHSKKSCHAEFSQKVMQSWPKTYNYLASR